MSKSKMKFYALMCSTALMATGNTSASAQEAETTADSNESVIVVTGSRIRRSNESAAIPVQILGAADVAEAGTVDTAEILRELPGVDESLSPEGTNASVQNSGLSTIALRRLGGNRTLTLINGRRVVSNSGNGERVSLNTIPAGFIKSIEVTTGGASAIYGSDAIAGVVNILLEDSLEGFKGNIRYSKAERSGERETTLDLSYGTKFSDDRGYFLASFSYDKETAIFADATRPESIALVEFNTPFVGLASGFGDERGFGNCGATTPDGTLRQCINPSGSSFLPGGRFEGDDAWNIGGIWFNDQSLLPADGRAASGAFGAFETDVDGFNFRPGRTISPEFESFIGGIRSTYEITPNTSIFFDAIFSRVETRRVGAANNASNTTDIGPVGASIDIGSIRSNHPFIPPEVEETRRGTVSFARRFTEVGRDDVLNQRDLLRTSFGLKGSAFNNVWDWEIYANYGLFRQEQTNRNELNFQNIRNALRIEDNGAGGFQCDDAAARADGCVPLNIFGEGSISAAAADYIRFTGRLNQRREQYVLGGSMNGDLFDLPAGPVKAAFGFEYRDERQETRANDPLELTSATFVPNFRGGFDVIEAYAEVDIPIIEDMLNLQFAGRIAQYSTIGTIFSYNAGASFQPIDGLRIRGQYSRSQRAPSLTEFFSAPRADFDNLTDPCNGLLPDGTGVIPPPGSAAAATTIAANCLTEPGIQAFFADPANAGVAFDGDDNVFGPNTGNQNLQEETADTFTLGAVITPAFLPSFSLIIDYYNISLSGAIGSVTTQLTTDLCYSDADFPNNRFCDVITRDATSGDVIQVINQQENLNSLKRSGIDVSLRYETELGVIPGALDLDVRYSHYFEDEFTFTSLAGPQTENELGEIGRSQDEFRAKLGYRHDGFRMTWTTIFRSGGVDDNDVLPTDPGFFRVGDQDYHNFFMNYSFGGDSRFSIYAGVNNVFNDLGPLLPTGLDNGNSRNIVNRLNDLEGREFYAGVRLRF